MSSSKHLGEGLESQPVETALWLLQFIGSATIAAAFLTLVGFLGRKVLGRWIESLFDRSLERYKAERAREAQGLEHQHAEKLEGIRYELSKLTHRVQQLHEKEIEVLAEAWKKLKAAEGAVFELVTVWGKTTDYDAMPDELLREAVAKLPFADYYKTEILKAKDKNAVYRRLMEFRKHSDAENSTNELSNYVLENAPFLSDELKTGFEKVIVAFRRTCITDETNRKAREMGSSMDREFLEWDEVGPLVRQIEDLIRQRLRYAEA